MRTITLIIIALAAAVLTACGSNPKVETDRIDAQRELAERALAIAEQSTVRQTCGDPPCMYEGTLEINLGAFILPQIMDSVPEYERPPNGWDFGIALTGSTERTLKELGPLAGMAYGMRQIRGTAEAGFGAAEGIAGSGFAATEGVAGSGFEATEGISGPTHIGDDVNGTQYQGDYRGPGDDVGESQYQGDYTGPNSGTNSGNAGRIESPDAVQDPAYPPAYLTTTGAGE